MNFVRTWDKRLEKKRKKIVLELPNAKCLYIPILDLLKFDRLPLQWSKVDLELDLQ